VSKSRDVYFCLGFYEFLGSQENHRIITGKSIDIYCFSCENPVNSKTFFER
jgi:hypothetical protein